MFRLPTRASFVARKRSQENGEARGMATLKAISIRLKSVKNIQKITQSMKMVSAAKYSRAERELKRVKPLGVGAKVFYTNFAKEGDEKEEKEKKEEQPKKTLYIALTSDRGLCGAVHTSVAKMIRTTLPEPNPNIGIICVGDKARSLLQRTYAPSFLLVCQEVGRLPPTFLDASKLAVQILNSEFEYENAKIIFNRFRSVVSYVTEEMMFYKAATILNSAMYRLYEDEDMNEDTIESFVEFSVASLIFYGMKEAACSEQSSRMTAMDNASKNASEMINQLTLTFNRTRQAVITRELIEIISGASAL